MKNRLLDIEPRPQRGGWRIEDRGWKAVALGLGLMVVLGGCGTGPLKGGRAVLTREPDGRVEQALFQGENSAQPTRQEHDQVRVRTYLVPGLSDAWKGLGEGRSGGGQGEGRSGRGEARGVAAPQPSALNPQLLLTEREESHTRTELGAAQKDNARELGARLGSMKGIVWVGLGLFVFGLGSLVWPPLRVLIGSVTTSAALVAGGLALMVLPSLIVGHELLLLGVVALAVGGWLLAHRHGELRGQVSSLKSKV